jgi:outer membrane protein assembly factor BamB
MKWMAPRGNHLHQALDLYQFIAMRVRLLLSIAISICLFTARGEDWPQFRGPGGRAVSETATPPIGFSPSSNLLWKVAIPGGVSSPVVTGERIFITGVTENKVDPLPLTGELNFVAPDSAKKIETLALDRKNGRILWRRNLGKEGTTTPTPVTDGKSVFVFFGGVIAYDLDGQEQWRHPIAKPDFSGSASPILIDDKLIIVCDRETDSFVEAFDKKTGRSLWRAERPQFRRARATPFHWKHGNEEELIVSGSFALTSYDPNNGQQKWRLPGAARWAMSSLAADENLLFALTMKEGVGEGPDEDGGPATGISIFDPAQLTGGETAKAASALRAIRPGGCTVVVWNRVRSLPYGNSPLYYKGRLFTVKSGGFVTAYDAKTGEPIYQDERINAPDDYWSSPVAADGRVYFASEKGIVTVMDATAATPTILAQNKLNEQILATPALIDRTILVRTATNLYSFGASK